MRRNMKKPTGFSNILLTAASIGTENIKKAKKFANNVAKNALKDEYVRKDDFDALKAMVLKLKSELDTISKSKK